MALTDTEVGKLLDVRLSSGVPLGEHHEMQANYLNHFSSLEKAQQLVQYMPRNPVEVFDQSRIIEKALRDQKREKQASGRRTWETNLRYGGGLIQGIRGRSGMPVWVLHEQARRNPLISSAHAQMRNFALRYTAEFKPHQASILSQREGFQIVLKGRPPHEALNKNDLAEREWMTQFLKYSGDAPRINPGAKTMADYRRLSFDNMLETRIIDRYVSAQTATELNFSYRGKDLRGFYSVDAGTIYDVIPAGEPGGGRWDPEYIYAQVVNNEIVKLLTANDLYLKKRNLSPQMGMNGYGIGEVEACQILTIGFLNVLTATNGYFDRNALPENLLALSGVVGDEALNAFREEYMAYRGDPGGAWGLPVLVMRDPAAKVQNIPMGKPVSDMGHQTYASLIMALVGSQYGMDVMSFNASMHGGSASNLGGGSSATARQDAMRGVGTLPLMRDLENDVNEMMSPLFGYKWEFQWTGLERLDPTWYGDVWKAAHDVDETRAIFGSKPKGGLVGQSLLANPAVSQQALVSAADGIDLGGDMSGVTNDAPISPDGGNKNAPSKDKAQKKAELLKAFAAFLDD